jgi:phosphoglycerol transferase MdoB-like AlkP superfamily enzyme
LRFWFDLTVIFLVIQVLVRTIFLFNGPVSFFNTFVTLFDGLIWDLGTWSIMSLPLILFSLLFKQSWWEKFQSSRARIVPLFIAAFLLTYVGVCELFFWQEFHSRFNFIAVDYLIYTNEVLANLRQSFPMGFITLGVASLAGVLTWGVARLKIKETSIGRLPLAGSFVALSLVFAFALKPFLETHEKDFHLDQLARNGFMEFYRAFRSNKIDYRQFYAKVPDEMADKMFSTKKVPLSKLPFPFDMKKPNVVVIVVESLGAKFIGPLGGDKSTTPYLNELAKNSVFFTNLYANGTRTVRGLEAINLSVPPTPGYAVVKRPEHKGLFSMGRTFAKNGYEPMFLYGGNGFFDNMNSFFGGNYYKVFDRGDFKKDEVTFENAWGACDEDMFRKADKIISERESKNPFLLFMLTTSNHRPFTYPEGRIDIPSGTGRAGAVKYTDYAIGKFLEESKKKEWAKNTVFVVIADHSTEGRGQFDLEMSDFHIPLWITAPGLQPKTITKLGSQIDLLPSLIHLLGLKDSSPFFGQSFFNENFKEERAFVGNYQFVGYYKNGVLTTLGPNRVIRSYSYDPATKKQTDVNNVEFRDEAIMYYQIASSLLDSGKFHEDQPETH